jgi:homoserine acetyltransferase
MEKNDHTFHYNEKFELEAGGHLTGFQLRYTTLGKLNAERNNVIWVCHALTGNSDFTDWWGGLFSSDGPFDHHGFLSFVLTFLADVTVQQDRCPSIPEREEVIITLFPC